VKLLRLLAALPFVLLGLALVVPLWLLAAFGLLLVETSILLVGEAQPAVLYRFRLWLKCSCVHAADEDEQLVRHDADGGGI